MVKETVEIQGKVNSDEVQKEFKGLQKEVNKLSKDFDKFGKDAQKDLKRVEKESKKTSKGVKAVGKGFKLLGTAMKAAGIGLVIALVAKLTEAFTRNQKVMDTVSSVFETINIVMSQITTAVTDAFDAAVKATGGFDALGKVMSGLLTLALTPIKTAFFGIKLGLQQAQLAWEKSFFGDGDPKTIKTLNEGIRETKNELKEIAINAGKAGADIVNNFSEAVGEVGTLVTETSEGLSKVSISAAKAQADQLVEARKQAEVNAALIEKSIFNYQLQAERIRQVRDDDKKSFQERIQANKELGLILQQQQEQELKLAQQRLSAAQQEVAAGNTTTEARVAVINAEKELLDIRERIAGFESEQQINRNALEREQLDAINARKEAESQLSFEKQRLAAEEIENERVRLERLREIAVEEREFELERLQEKINNTNAETQARVDAEIEFAERKLELDQKIKESENSILQFKKKANKEEAKNEAVLQKQKLSLTQNTLGKITSILGENSKAGKAAAIAQSAINTYQGVTEVWSTKSALPEPFATASRIASTATVLASGLASVKKIKSTQLPNIGSGGGGASAGGGSVGASQAQAQAVAPSFDVVGDTGTNQIADVLGENANRPQKAYVVGSDVTTQQELDRNIEDGSSIG
jgi:hypothetical protein